MRYCINPNCSNRHNSDNCDVCQTCGTKLLINERYQIVKPLRVGLGYNSEVFEVKDFNERGTFKVLKSLSPNLNNSGAAKLFKKEAQSLIWLSTNWHRHPGIPEVQPDAYFSCSINNSLRPLSCLVMEKIEGQNLEQWLKENQCISEEQAIDWLQQLIHILDKVHQQGLWHRDIKPSNIMLKPDGQLVLIDFGAVGIGSTVIASAEYTPPEQITGATVLQSDFFAVGRTFVYLLTGKHPHELTKSSNNQQLIWRSEAAQVSDQLADLIDKLMAPLPQQRPQTAQEILDRLQFVISTKKEQTNVFGKLKKLLLRNKLKILVVGGLIIALALPGIINLIPCQTLSSFKSCPPTKSDHLSFGEKILIPGSPVSEKLAGVKAFLAGNYTEAVKWLEQARAKQKNDPETLIYLNNARLEAKKAQAYTVAVVAPLDTSNDIQDSSLEILRGVAQTQDEIYQNKTNKIKLKILIADDQNDTAKAQKIAKELATKDEVLAVIGHVRSEITSNVVDIYKQNQLVLISPTSSSEGISNYNSQQSNFFFRTVSNSQVTAQALTSYLFNYSQKRKVAVFYNSNDAYSRSLWNQFKIYFSSTGGKLVQEVDLSSPIFSAEKAVDEAQKQETSALVLFPDMTTRSKALDVVKANSHRYLMVGGDSVYNANTLKMAAQDAKDLVIASPWHTANKF